MTSLPGIWWGFIGSPDMPEYEVTRSPMGLQGVALLRFLGPKPALGVSRCDIRKRLSHWLINQQLASWRDLGNTLRQTRELISGPCPGTRIKLLSFNRNQSRVVTGLLTGHNTLRRHLYLFGLLDSPLCKKCGVKEETSAHILRECEALASLRHRYLGSFFLEPEDVKSITWGPSGALAELQGSPDFDMGHKGPVNIA
jgi:hypothetical protein